ncbi:Lactonase, 7-bladed beta-propeller domain-containing protein [Trichoderma chlorosporum]
MSRRLLIARPGHIYLATYTSATAKISIDLDEPFPGIPSWFAVSPADSSLLYTFDEDGSTTYVFRLDLAANRLTKVAQSEDGSEGVCHLAFNKLGTILLGTSYAEGTIDVWNTESSSTPKLITTIQSKDPVIDAGRVARAHQAVLDPTGRFFVVNDLGTDSLLVLDVLRPDVPVVRRVTVPSGSGPRHGVFYPAGEKPATHYFLLCETSNRVEVFELKYTETDIEFVASGSYSTFLDEESGAFAAAGEIVLSADGGHVYVSNRLMTTPTETIAHFRIKPESESEGEDGGLSLELVAETSTQGKHPRMFSLSRNGNELFVGNQEGEWAVVVLRRREDGTLEDKPVAGILMEDIVKGEGDERGPMFVLEVV